MNIFATSPNPSACAQALDDKRVVKMCLETTQLLSTALVTHLVSGENLYKPTHNHHPCTLWTAYSFSNFNWLLDHGLYLFKEYYNRFKKEHASVEVMNRCYRLRHFIPKLSRTPFPNCARRADLGLDFTALPVHDAYRAYLNARWKGDLRPPKWNQYQSA